VFADARGTLTLLHLEELPFTAARAYVISDVPVGARRGGHSSRVQHRFLVGISGESDVTLDDGTHTATLSLGGGDTLHVPPRVWFELVARVEPVTILVLADGRYDPSDQIAEPPAAPGALKTGA
jgi:glyoxylate utilization-related uncharacterized protein